MSVLKQGLNARQSNIELLRIFAMVMIIAHHIGVHSNFDLCAQMPVMNKLWIQFVQMGGKIGVDIFVLISGYFLITAKSLKLSKVAKLWLQLCTYSVGLYVAFAFFNGFSVWGLLGRFSPVINSSWWFANTYFIMFILSPFINIGLNALGQKNHLRALLVMTVLWSVIPTFGSNRMESNSLIWFVYLYALAGYIRLYVDLKQIKSKTWFAVAGAATILTYLLAVGLDLLGVESVFNAHSSDYFFDMQRLPILLISLALLLAFLGKDMGCSAGINVIASATFGVYLLHDYGDMRPALWQWLFRNETYQDSLWLIPYTILQMVLVFAGCAAIELLRIYLIEKRYMKHMDRLIEKARAAAKKLLKKNAG